MTRKQTLEATRDREVAALAKLRSDYAWHVEHSTYQPLLTAFESAVAWREMRIANVERHIAELPIKQARFWIDYKGSVVRLKLSDGQIVDVLSGGATDEGYSWRAERYSFEGGIVTCEETVDARDCDGRISRQSHVTCLVSRLSSGWHDPVASVTFPAWEQAGCRQRDYSAEAMNY